MGREWKIGDPVDYTTDGWMDAQNWGHGSDDDEDEDNYGFFDNSPDPRIMEYSKKAWDLYMDFKDDEALYYINMALDLDDRNSKNWNIKAIILESLKRFEESERCYDTSLRLHHKNLVHDNRMRMFYSWAAYLLEESKDVPDGGYLLNEAKHINEKAIESFLGKDSEESLDKYQRQRDSIEFYINYENEFKRKIQILNEFDKGELFTIAGSNFYKTGVKLVTGKSLELVREPENEHDSDAIAVYCDGKKIGYVANSDHTRFRMTSSASELKNVIQGSVKASYLFYLDRYSEIQFHIGRII